jgi:hypothetical protein
MVIAMGGRLYFDDELAETLWALVSGLIGVAIAVLVSRVVTPLPQAPGQEA